MKNKQRTLFVIGFIFLLVIAVYIINFYFLYQIDDQPKTNEIDALQRAIQLKVRHLHPNYLNQNPRFLKYQSQLIKYLKYQKYNDASSIWETANAWSAEAERNEIYPLDFTIGQLLYTLQNEPITNAENARKGTQLKLMLKLSNKQNVIFKPQWYTTNHIIDGPVFAGKDRHNAEVYSFYLAAVLNLRWTPIAVGRKINLKEIYERADSDLRKTMTLKENNNRTQYCVYGKCYYCNKDEAVCGDENNTIDGVIIFLITGAITKHRSPWQRSYKEGIQAEWEHNINYCNGVKNKLDTTRLLDLVDASIFDFLIQNGDRHHYETRQNRLVLIDNGKSFGNPNKDFFDVLAPLYQCCIIRNSTWNRLNILSGGTLTDIIDQLSKQDQLYPLINEKHRLAIERRLLIVFAVVEHCLNLHEGKIFKS